MFPTTKFPSTLLELLETTEQLTTDEWQPCAATSAGKNGECKVMPDFKIFTDFGKKFRFLNTNQFFDLPSG